MSRSLVFAAALLAAVPAWAGDNDSIFSNTGQENLALRDGAAVKFNGYLRTRGAAFYNHDLDRGVTPSGETLFPVPLADANNQWMTLADMRLRTDLAFYAPGGTVVVKARADLLDNLALGSLPEGAPMGSSTQSSPQNLLRLKRAWGEALTPLGILAVGRMGNQWGLGMLANSGDCMDCDSGDAADRIAFVAPVAGHLWALAYDFTSVGPVAERRNKTLIDIEPSDRVSSVTFAVMRYKDELTRERRRKAGRTTIEYGAYVSYRNQSNDIPAWYVPAEDPVTLDSSQVMRRGWSALAVDGWARLTMPSLRIEMEGAVLVGALEESSLIAGVEMRDRVDSLQWGVALESDIGAPEDRVRFGLDLGVASGDATPGFGAFPGVGETPPKAGDLDGPQADPPRDNRIDNFRFHPDYRIDRILFREIIGTVTDAFYVRPHLNWKMAEVGPGHLSFSLAAIASFALYAASTPGGQSPLGVELDPTLLYETRYGFQASLDYAFLYPLAGLDNPAEGLVAKPAQSFRLRLVYVF